MTGVQTCALPISEEKIDRTLFFVYNLYIIHKQNEIDKNMGLVIMDTPGNDPSSVAGMAAGGCQICLFSTGRGTPTGNPIVPVIKITGNKVTYANMSDNIDIDASPYIYGKKTLEELGDELFTEIKQVADGKLTKAEALGYTEMAIARVCNYM